MKKAELPMRAKQALKYLLDSDGELIYSSHETLKKGDVYLMGLNPGGGGVIKINDHIDKMLTRDENSYIDESWENGKKIYAAGTAPLQKRVRWLIENLGYNTRDICATNLIFKTTKSADELCFGLAGICWTFHEYVLDIVKPKLILTFGNSETSSPYSFLKSLFNGEETKINANHGDWACKGFRAEINGINTFIVGLPHLSYYNIINKSHVIDWILENINFTK